MCKGAALTCRKYGACGASGVLTFWNKISKWYSKAVASGEEEPGAEDAHQVVLFLSMLDGLDDKHKDKRAADTLAYCELMEGELVRLAIGYGEDYGAEHAVRSAASADFPSTLLYPGDALSHTPFTDVVDMQPNKNGHGDDILRVIREGVTMSEVGDAYQIDGWMVICMLCILKGLSAEDLDTAALLKLEKYARSFKKDTGFHASPAVFASWLKERTMPWKQFVCKAGVL